MSDFTYYFFCVKYAPKRRWKLPSGKSIDANIFIEVYNSHKKYYFVHSVGKINKKGYAVGNMLECLYDGKDKNKAWSYIPEDATYLGNSDKFEYDLDVGYQDPELKFEDIL